MRLRRLLLIAGLALAAAGAGMFGWENAGTNMMAAPTYRQEISHVQASAVPLPIVHGKVYAVIQIPAIGLIAPLIQGTDADSLTKGVGHYENTPMPGRLGNAALAGHRTTYGRPFWDLQKLKADDLILIVDPAGTFTYRVRSHEIVAPDHIGMLATSDVNARELTLTTCHPRFTALQRYVVHAQMSGAQSPTRSSLG